MEYSYTAELEGAFDLIANRKAEYLAVVHGAWEKLQTELTEFKGEIVAANQADEIKPLAQPKKEPVKRECSPGDKCPSCEGGKLTVKKLNNGANAGRSFIGCTRFPSCRFFNWMH
jgi:ssDNA-binding Zn-finger/Zn-ribbon topoisomerase 1